MRDYRSEARYGERDDDVELRRDPLPSPGKVTLTGKILRKASGPADADRSWELIDRARAGGGAALPADLRGKFEQSLGAPLDGVRIHTGEAANDAAKALGARAFTVGQDVVFGAGQYDPSSSGGVHLIAHEVAHTVQQIGQQAPAPANKNLEVSEPGDSLEREADAAADAMVAGAKAEVGAGDSTIARDPDPQAQGQDGQAQEPVGPKSGTISGEDFDPGEAAGGCDLHGPDCMGGHDVKVVADFSYVPSVTQTSWSGGSVGHDAVSAAGIGMASEVNRGGVTPGSAFGKATPKFYTKDLSWKLENKTVYITGQVLVKVWWDVQSRGRVNIETAEDGYIGPGNYMQAFYDLSGDVPKREFFWMQSLTMKHEQFHVKEYLDNSKKETAAAAADISKKQIKVPMVLGKDEAIQTQVDPIVKDLAKNVGNKVLATFDAGGESRAYADGAQGYKTLADAIRLRGEKLGWDKQGKNKNNPNGGMVPRDNMPTDNVPDSDQR